MLDEETIKRLKLLFEARKLSFSEETVFILNSIILHFKEYFLNLSFENMKINCIAEGNIMSGSNQLLPTQLMGKKKSNIITFNDNNGFSLKGVGLFDVVLLKQKPEMKITIRLPEILSKYNGQFEKKITSKDSETLSYFMNKKYKHNNSFFDLNNGDEKIKSMFSKINYDITLYDYNKDIEKILSLSLSNNDCITYIIEKFVFCSEEFKEVFDKILLLESTINSISKFSINSTSANAICLEINNKKIKEFLNIEEMIKMMALHSDCNECQSLKELQKLSKNFLNL